MTERTTYPRRVGIGGAAFARAALMLGGLLLAAASAGAAAPACLPGADVGVTRQLVDAQCPCASFDGRPGKTHAAYKKCVRAVVAGALSADKLRWWCAAPVRKYYSNSTCGLNPAVAAAPCITTNAAGAARCKIKPSATCGGTVCSTVTTCIDAGDTNGDGIVGAGDSGQCAYTDNGDGTISDPTGLVWEKKDQAGGLHDVNALYSWAGLCGCTTGSCTGTEPLCQPNAAAASACAAQTGGADGCATCTSGTCNIDPFANIFGATAVTTVWDWISQLNAANFAGHSDWRLPFSAGGGPAPRTIPAGTPEELGGASGCVGGAPCVSPVFNNGCTPGCTAPACSCTAGGSYWSASTFGHDSRGAWAVPFAIAPNFSLALTWTAGEGLKSEAFHARAVRTGP